MVLQCVLENRAAVATSRNYVFLQTFALDLPIPPCVSPSGTLQDYACRISRIMAVGGMKRLKGT